MSVLRIPADREPKQAAQRGKGARRLKAVGPNVRRCCEDARGNRFDRTLRDGERSERALPGPRLRAVPTAATPDEGKVGDAKAQSAGRLAPLREGRSPRVATPPRRGKKKAAPAGGGSLAPRAPPSPLSPARPWSSGASSWEVFCFPPNGKRLSFNRGTRCGRSPPESKAPPALQGRSRISHS